MDEPYKKMRFSLEQDEDGYPPYATEGIWVLPLESGRYRIENIPFYARGISCEDIVEGEFDETEALTFVSLASASGRSTFRVIVHDPKEIEAVRGEIKRLGADTEVHLDQQMIAVDVPADVAVKPLLNYLVDSRASGVSDFEEGALRHKQS
jgi:hypothetical protein